MAFPHRFRALNSRNYRLFFSGQAVSLVGNWMTITTSAWLVYHLSGSALYVGAVGFCTQIPLLLFGPFTGVWVDRLNRHRALVLLQVAALLQSAALAGFTSSGHMTVPLLLTLCVWQGLINAWEYPVRQSLMISLVARREDLPSAIALGSTMFNLARLVGPAMAGFVIAHGGADLSYAIDAVSYLPVIAMLLLMRLPVAARPPGRTHPLADLRAGLSYVHHHPRLRIALALVPVVTLAGWAHSILAPVVARELFGGDSRLLGFILSATGGGAIIGAIMLAGRPSAEGLPRVIVRGVALIALAQALYAGSTWLPLTLAASALAGYGGVCAMAGNNTWVQSLVDDDKRGRVMGLFAMGQGMFPVGSLAVGALAEWIGLRPTIAGAAAVCLLASVAFAHIHRRRAAALAAAARP